MDNKVFNENSFNNEVGQEKRTNSRLIASSSASKAPFAVVEAYKNIRIRLLSILQKASDKKIIAISSPNAAAGKSTTSVNLAITLSQIGKKVILIDSDIRRATIDKKLRIESRYGCVDVLSGQCGLQDALINYNPYLDILTSGEMTSTSSDLLCSTSFDKLLSELRKEYDYIIIDTPPINLVSDTLAIAQKSDGVILLTKVGLTTYAEVKSALETLRILDIDVLGTIINGVEGISKKYYKSYYGYK